MELLSKFLLDMLAVFGVLTQMIRYGLVMELRVLGKPSMEP